jgi:serine/threonine protein kinase
MTAQALTKHQRRVHPVWPHEKTEAGAPPPAGSPNGSSGDIIAADAINRAKAAVSKFTFPSGSRPLDGYTIKRGVGIGGFGEVYFATSDAGKEVALKRIQRNLDIELRGVRQCLNLKHQNLVALYDIRYDEQEQAWVVMEFVPGASLKDVIEQHPSGMPIEDVHLWFRGLAAGTAYLHDHGIVHRDLKPGNIFEDDGCVKIGDYGLSKFISCSRRSGQTESVGTFHYMAPEIGKGNYGREIDIYALGIILYEMLTGNVPFDGESTQEIIMKHLTADPDVSRMAQPYRYVIQRAMLKDPQKRFSSVYEMVDALGLASPSEISTVNRSAIRPIVSQPIETPPIAFAAPEPLFIGEDAEMVFGPVKVSSIPGDVPPGGYLPASGSPPFVASSHNSAPAASPQPLVSTAEIAPAATASRSGSPFWDALDLENEPVARYARQGLASVNDWWSSPALATWVRITVVIVVLIAIASATVLLPAILAIFLGYCIYLAIRVAFNYSQGNVRRRVSAPSSAHYPTTARGGLFTPSNGTADIAAPPIVSSPPRNYTSAPASHRTAVPAKFNTSVFTPEYLRRERRSMLLTSMLLSAICAIGLSIATALALQGRASIQIGDTGLAAFATWLSVVTVASTWVVLIVNRFFDTSRGMSVLHRIVMGGAGAMIACGALALQQFLAIDQLPPIASRFLRFDVNINQNWPVAFSTVAFFFALFAMIRWWKNSDPMRSSRFRSGATFVAMLFGALIGMVAHYPHPWHVVIAGILAISLQFGASRFSSKRRAELNQPFAIGA